MLTNMRWKVLFTALCLIPLSLSMPSNGYAGNKEGPDLTTERLFGHINGLLTFEFIALDAVFGEVFVAFAGKCKDSTNPHTKIEVAITAYIPGVERAAFEDMTKTGDNGLRYFRLEGRTPPGCQALPVDSMIIITEVDKFINAVSVIGLGLDAVTVRVIGAEVVVRGIGPR